MVHLWSSDDSETVCLVQVCCSVTLWCASAAGILLDVRVVSCDSPVLGVSFPHSVRPSFPPSLLPSLPPSSPSLSLSVSLSPGSIRRAAGAGCDRNECRINRASDRVS